MHNDEEILSNKLKIKNSRPNSENCCVSETANFAICACIGLLLKNPAKLLFVYFTLFLCFGLYTLKHMKSVSSNRFLIDDGLIKRVYTPETFDTISHNERSTKCLHLLYTKEQTCLNETNFNFSTQFSYNEHLKYNDDFIIYTRACWTSVGKTQATNSEQVLNCIKTIKSFSSLEIDLSSQFKNKKISVANLIYSSILFSASVFCVLYVHLQLSRWECIMFGILCFWANCAYVTTWVWLCRYVCEIQYEALILCFLLCNVHFVYLIVIYNHLIHESIVEYALTTCNVDEDVDWPAKLKKVLTVVTLNMYKFCCCTVFFVFVLFGLLYVAVPFIACAYSVMYPVALFVSALSVVLFAPSLWHCSLLFNPGRFSNKEVIMTFQPIEHRKQSSRFVLTLQCVIPCAIFIILVIIYLVTVCLKSNGLEAILWNFKSRNINVLTFARQNSTMSVDSMQRYIVDNVGEDAFFPLFDTHHIFANKYQQSVNTHTKYNPFTPLVVTNTTTGLNSFNFYISSFHKTVMQSVLLLLVVPIASLCIGLMTWSAQVMIASFLQSCFTLLISHIMRVTLSLVVLQETSAFALHAENIWLWLLTIITWVYFYHILENGWLHSTASDALSAFTTVAPDDMSFVAKSHTILFQYSRFVYWKHLLSLVIVTNTLDNGNGNSILICMDYAIFWLSCQIL